MDLCDGGRNLAYRYSIDYAPKGLEANSRAVDKTVNRIQAAGSTDAFESTAALIFSQESVKDLNKVYRQLAGATATAFPQSALDAGLRFQQELSSSLASAPLHQGQRCLQELQQLKAGETYQGDPAREQGVPRKRAASPPA